MLGRCSTRRMLLFLILVGVIAWIAADILSFLRETEDEVPAYLTPKLLMPYPGNSTDHVHVFSQVII